MKKNIRLQLAHMLKLYKEVSTEQGILCVEGEDFNIGDEVFLITEDNEVIPAHDAEYKAGETVYVIVDGKLAEIREEKVEDPEPEKEPEQEPIQTEEQEPEKEPETEPAAEPTDNQALIDENTALKAENEELKAKVAELEAKVAELEAKIKEYEEKAAETEPSAEEEEKFEKQDSELTEKQKNAARKLSFLKK